MLSIVRKLNVFVHVLESRLNHFVFIITDLEHKVYYASNSLFSSLQLMPSEVISNNWMQFITFPTISFAESIIAADIQENGFYNGYLKFGDNMTYCDYSKRYDPTGKQIGYELTITKTNEGAENYMMEFYENLSAKVSSQPELTVEQVYLEEQGMIKEISGTDFHEFMIELQR